MATRSRKFVITHNNYEENTIAKYKKLQEEGVFRYLILGKEVAKTGTKHLQGYVQLYNPLTIRRFQKYLQAHEIRTSIQIAKGTLTENQKYCKKEGNFVEFGEGSTQGKRTDLERFYQDIKDGKDNYYLQEHHMKTYLKYHKAADKCRRNCRQHESVEILKKEFTTVKFRNWQQKALDNLAKQDNRKIDWIVDEEGNRGKTFLAK